MATSRGGKLLPALGMLRVLPLGGGSVCLGACQQLLVAMGSCFLCVYIMYEEYVEATYQRPHWDVYPGLQAANKMP